MVKYAYVENGEVKKVQNNLPKNTKITSNFPGLTEEQRRKQGWYIINETDNSKEEYETSHLNYIFENGEVIETQIKEEIDIEKYRTQKLDKIKSM